MLTPRESGKFIASRSQHVKIVPDGVNKVSQLVFDAIKDDSIRATSWYSTHNKYPDAQAVEWCFVADLLNFSFWSSGSDKFEVTYKGKTETGYYGCCALINKALDNGIPLTDSSFYGNLTLDKLKEIFTADDGSIIPMIEQRHKCLVESAAVLQKKFNGTFFTCVQHAKGSAQKLLDIIVENFPSFRDCAEYDGKQVSFLKRAQVLVADVHSCLQERSPGNFSDIDSLTMFADYRVPQVLTFLGALEYSDELMEVLKKETVMASGDVMEVELRGCSIECVEQIVDKTRLLLKQDGLKDKTVNSASVDYFLWCYRRSHAKEASKIPYHRVRSIFY